MTDNCKEMRSKKEGTEGLRPTEISVLTNKTSVNNKKRYRCPPAEKHCDNLEILNCFLYTNNCPF